ncbi:conserved hypothetical protein [Halorhabdus utahensis DSM 12940]|uniref:DNA recombination and repair protein Rad51-like C-terminal domain-containing protein n=1 Tax=Halorhabdus utahensis (strain DSM 12940 / JCM 11049 / AX-2) TaxID=519442 RepID=C7NSH1_HALUD|nr:hypothetical protein [Halorhabdus utahensis]ACV12058.1 conserved hypothetical protein [Halorhabdus utahensis DSM 12940]
MEHDAITGRMGTDSRRGGSSIGDPRWPASSREDLPGQRARQRSSGEIDDAATAVDVDDGLALPELPTLEDDLYLLEPDAGTARSRRDAVVGPLHALALDTALSAGGDVVWVDAGGHATTHAFARVAPAERALDRVHVARAFTTHQHYTLVEQLGRWLRGDGDSPFGAPATDRPAVVVAPALDALYRKGEIRDGDAGRLLSHSLATLAAIAREHDIPVVLTRSRADSDTDPIEAAATTIALEETQFGPRFACDDLDFETLVYRVEEGVHQTTITYWAEILRARHPAVASGGSVRASGSGSTAQSLTIGPAAIR